MNDKVALQRSHTKQTKFNQDGTLESVFENIVHKKRNKINFRHFIIYNFQKQQTNTKLEKFQQKIRKHLFLMI